MPQADKPALTSGPGAMSRRTDGGPASKQSMRYISGMPSYGDGQDLMNLQAQAPMGATPDISKGVPLSMSAAPQQAQTAGPALTPLLAPTQRPNEPITAGVPMGAGPGPEALGIMPGQMGGASARDTVKTLASNPDASPELIQLANLLGQ